MYKTDKKARILLLNPPTAASSDAILLSLAYLTASLRKRDHEVKIVDATAPYRNISPREIRRIISDFMPHFIGVTLTVTYIPQTYLYLKELRTLGIPIVCGGPHASCLPEEVLENGADIVAIGEGEETITELAEYFLGDKPVRQIAGLCLKDENGKILYTPSRGLIKDLDGIPFPDFGDFPIRNYTGSDDPDSNPMFWTIFTSRGCPFNCTFCSSHNVFGNTVRLRSAHNVFREIDSLVNRFGTKRITFQDDEILCSKKRFKEMCDLIANSPLKIKMSIRTRIDSIDKDVLLKMKATGITRTTFGIESWCDETLERINKKYRLSEIREGFRAIEEIGFPYVSFNNIWGFPWETGRHFKQNFKEISKIPKTIAYFTTVGTPLPYPKTELYDMYHERYGFTKWWLDQKINSPLIEKARKPFFMHFVMAIYTLHSPEVYWNYPKKIRSHITYWSWKLFGLFSRRHLTLIEYLKVISLCRMSYFLWRISPVWENMIFRVFLNSKMLGLVEKLTFTTKY